MQNQGKTYIASRTPEGEAHISVAGQPLDMRLEVCNHSPTGFEWGYAGSGPAQTALALLADTLGDNERALAYHQAYKHEVIATLPYAGFALSQAGVKAWAEAHEWAIAVETNDE